MVREYQINETIIRKGTLREKYSIKEKQTRNGLRLLLVLDQVHTIEKLLTQLRSLTSD